jgi:hypothetical protein
MHARSASSQPAPRSPAAAVGPRCSTSRPHDSMQHESSSLSCTHSPNSETMGVWPVWAHRNMVVQMHDVAHRSHGPTQPNAPDGLARGSKAPRHAELVEDAEKRPMGCALTQRRVDAYSNRRFVIDTTLRLITRPIAWMNAARKPSWSCLPPAQSPRVRAHTASPCLARSDPKFVPAMGCAYATSAAGALGVHLPSRLRRRGELPPGGSDQRSAHTFAEILG